MQFVFKENGEIMIWGAEVIGGISLDVPADWEQYGVQKYVANDDRTALVVREGWEDPVAQTE